MPAPDPAVVDLPGLVAYGGPPAFGLLSRWARRLVGGGALPGGAGGRRGAEQLGPAPPWRGSRHGDPMRNQRTVNPTARGAASAIST